jgi:hypothetical protein
MVELVFAEFDDDLVAEDFEVWRMRELLGEHAANCAPIIEGRGEGNGFVTESEKKKGVIGIIGISPEYFPLKQVLVLRYLFPRLCPFQTDSTMGQDN